MNVKELKKGRSYYYTANSEWIKVIYKHETINGYLFTSNDENSILTKQDIEQYIEEL